MKSVLSGEEEGRGAGAHANTSGMKVLKGALRATSNARL